MSTAAPLHNTAAKSRQVSNSSDAGLLLQRMCACGGSGGLVGQCDKCQTNKLIGLQTKLAVSEPGDVYEREADRIADQVMATPADPSVSSAPPHIQRFSGQSNGQLDATPASVYRVLASPGSPLEPVLRQDMEQRFGHDFSRVRVHSDANAEQSAREVRASAYTVGHDIVFGTGRFAPGTHEGRRLIAHELTHVVQQSGADGMNVGLSNDKRGLSPIVPHKAWIRFIDRSTPYGGSGSTRELKAPSSTRWLQALIASRAAASLARVVLQRAPAKRKPQTDPRSTHGHRDPLIKEPATGSPVVEVTMEGGRSISWSWEVQRPGTPATGGQPFREQVYWATFEVDAQGVMRASVRMVSQSGQFRAPEWTLRSKFKEALEAFRLAGIQVRAFEAEWGYMSRGEISGNLDAYFKYLRHHPGESVNAARATPSGKVAIENGFTKVSVPDVGADPNQEHLQATKNRARQVCPVVRVRFALPGTTLPDEAPPVPEPPVPEKATPASKILPAPTQNPAKTSAAPTSGGGRAQSFETSEPVRAEMARLNRLREVERVLTEYGRFADTQYRRGPEFRQAREALQRMLDTFMDTTSGRARGTMSNPDDLTRALAAAQATRAPVENLLTPEFMGGVEDLKAKRPYYRIFEREVAEARRTGRMSDKGINALWELEPDIARKLLGGSGMSRKARQEAARLVPGQPAPMKFRSAAAVLVLIEAVNLAGPLIQGLRERAFGKYVQPSLEDITWWEEKGVRPAMTAVDDNFWPFENEWREEDERARIQELLNDREVSYLALTGIPEQNWDRFTLWASAKLKNYRDWHNHIIEAKAIRVSGGRYLGQQTFEYRTSRIHATATGHEVEEIWYRSDRLDKILQAPARDVVSTSSEQLGQAEAQRGEPLAGVSQQGGSRPLYASLPPPTGRMKFRPGAEPVLYTLYEQRRLTGYSPNLVFFTFPPHGGWDFPDDYVLVGGADFNTYAQVFASRNRIKLELGGRYGGYVSRYVRPNVYEVLLARRADLVGAK